MQLLAARAARLLRKPAHERGAVPAPAPVGAGDEVVDVEGAAPREVLLDAKAGDGAAAGGGAPPGGFRRAEKPGAGAGFPLARREEAGEPVARGALAVGDR